VLRREIDTAGLAGLVVTGEYCNRKRARAWSIEGAAEVNSLICINRRLVVHGCGIYGHITKTGNRCSEGVE
jgi:hypothetical protein